MRNSPFDSLIAGIKLPPVPTAIDSPSSCGIVVGLATHTLRETDEACKRANMLRQIFVDQRRCRLTGFFGNRDKRRVVQYAARLSGTSAS